MKGVKYTLEVTYSSVEKLYKALGWVKLAACVCMRTAANIWQAMAAMLTPPSAIFWNEK
jgi:hypothetical protein